MDLFDYMHELERKERGEEAPPPSVFDDEPEAEPEPELTLAERETLLEEIAQQVAVCTVCRLCEKRTNTVPGEGNAAADVMFIGEAPGYNEDMQGRPFVGRAGELLTRIIEAMGFRREEVFIANVAKCRPPDNRKPLADEMEACLPYLRRQIEAIRPKVIVALGKTALEGLLSYTERIGITRLRGQWHYYEGIPVMPTFHPAYLLRSPQFKREVWDDMKAVLKQLGREPPERKRAGRGQG